MVKTKNEIFEKAERMIKSHGLLISEKDDTRPWGGFFVIEEKSAEMFSKIYFNKTVSDTYKISPKILIVAPGKRLSWQYHHRRSELWKLIEGDARIIKSFTDNEHDSQEMILGETVRLEQGERHRLIGGKDWGIVAEIWIHTNIEHPSNEEDIVRLQDDYGRR